MVGLHIVVGILPTCSLLCCCLDSCSCCFILVWSAAEPTTGTGMNLHKGTKSESEREREQVLGGGGGD